MSETVRALLQFAGVSLMALIAANAVRQVCDMLGPDGVESVRKMRERLFRD